jgi:hypothetical protein
LAAKFGIAHARMSQNAKFGNFRARVSQNAKFGNFRARMAAQVGNVCASQLAERQLP